MTDVLEIKLDIKKQVAQLTKLGKLEFVTAGLKAGALHVKGVISKYPASSYANSPSAPRWYQRGYGPKWKTRDGVHGRKTSETLGRKWTIAEVDWGTVRIGNNASYAPYVHDTELQASFHQARGWRATEETADSETPVVQQFLERYLQAEIDKTGG